MATRIEKARRRRWADVVVILAGIFVFAFAIWFPPVGEAEQAGEGVRDEGAWWWVHAIGGALAVASLFVTFKSARAAKLMVGAAGLILLGGLLVFRQLGWVSLVTVGLPGVLLLIAAPFVGPMPTPEEEGKRR